MKQLVYKILAFVPLGIFMVLVSYFNDPAHLFRNGIASNTASSPEIVSDEAEIAKILLSGSNVANVGFRDGRLLQKYYIEGLTHRKDVIVMGSSRAMQITPDYLFRQPIPSFFNHGVPKCSIQDYLAIYELYCAKKFKPRIVVLELPPWILNHNNGLVQWQSLQSEYQAARVRLGLQTAISEAHTSTSDDAAPTPKEPRSETSSQAPVQASLARRKYLELLSPAYYQRSFQAGLIALLDPSASKKYYSTAKTVGPTDMILENGVLVYGSRIRSRTVGDVRQYVQRNRDDTALATSTKLGAQEVIEFEAFVQYLHNQGIQVLFVLTPYHPLAYSGLRISPKSGFIDAVESYFSAYSKSHGILLVGSYNPEISSCSENDFYDENHLRGSGLTKLFSKVHLDSPTY